jgi:hypothetical protein
MKRKTRKPENVPKLKLQTRPCMLCRLCQGEHSEQLWKMHKGTVEMAQSKTQHKKLWTMQIGFGPRCAALLDNDYESETVIQRHGFLETVVPSGLNPAEHLHPIYMSCTGCGLYLGKTEEEYGDMLGGMCLKCFRELIGQTDVWYDKPHATRILKEGVRIRMYRNSKGEWWKLYGNFTDAHHCGEDSH